MSSAIVAYFASFVLIRYRLNNAVVKEAEVMPAMSRQREASTSTPYTERRSTEKRRAHGHSHHTQPRTRRPSGSVSSTLGPGSPVDFGALADAVADVPQEIYTDIRALVSVTRAHPLWFLPCGARAPPDGVRDPEAALVGGAAAALQDMVGVLARAHTVCAGMTLLGFVLALLGILTYSWTEVPTALGVFSSVCMGSCAIAALIALW